ncbi:Alkanesulfonate transporter substrate-binding subunit OS=Afipia felis OX=1035 GN=NCTC12722_01015 PE=4 SV=1 [Afipia felis]
MRRHLAGLLTLLTVSTFSTAAPAETSTVRLAKQYGISYLTLTVMEERKLIEKHARQQGLDVKTEWLRFSAGSGMNEALLAGNLDFAAGGIPPLLTIWDKTRNNLKVKGVVGLNLMPYYLITTNPKIKTIADFSSSDKIALPAIKTSIQAVVLQMAAEKKFGPGQHNRLDPLTVSMGHPDAMAAMLSGHTEINAHFGTEPFQTLELRDKRTHLVLNSYDVTGGEHTNNVVWATSKFVQDNPKVTKAVIAAVQESEEMIKADPAGIAALWVKAENSKIPVADAEKIIRDPKNKWTTTPRSFLSILQFMNKAGSIKSTATNITDIFFDDPSIAGGN